VRRTDLERFIKSIEALKDSDASAMAFNKQENPRPPPRSIESGDARLVAALRPLSPSKEAAISAYLNAHRKLTRPAYVDAFGPVKAWVAELSDEAGAVPATQPASREPVDSSDTRSRRFNLKTVKEFISSYIAHAANPTINGAEAAAREAGFVGGRDLVRKEYHSQMRLRTGQPVKQGRRRKLPKQSAKK
jgi:hypothetical protein